MKELKIGERVTIILEAVEHEGYSCKGCFFELCYGCPFPCFGTERSDHKNIIFKEVKE